jgi:hypothetical protein
MLQTLQVTSSDEKQEIILSFKPFMQVRAWVHQAWSSLSTSEGRNERVQAESAARNAAGQDNDRPVSAITIKWMMAVHRVAICNMMV